MPSDGRAGGTTGSAIPRPAHICMHVVGVARTDQRVLREARALRDAGYEVTIVDVEPDPQRPPQEDFDGIHLRHVIMPSRFKPTRFKPYFLVKQARVRLRATSLMRQVPAEAYHAHDANALQATYRAARRRRQPLVFDSHELPYVARQTARDRFLASSAKRQLTRLIPRCAAVITVCDPIGEELARRYGGPTPVIIRNLPPYTPPQRSNRLREHLGLPPTARIALYQGGIQPNRGLDKTVLAGKFLPPDHYIVLLGYGPSVEPLKALVEREQLGDRVKILPAVPYAELLSWTASADLGLNVLPPDFSLSIKYSLPNKLFEYLMVGLPVLSSDLPAAEAVLRIYGVGRVVPSLEPRAIAQAIIAMLADSAGLARMRQNALDAARQLNWEIEQRRLLELYANLPGVGRQSARGGIVEPRAARALSKPE